MVLTPTADSLVTCAMAPGGIGGMSLPPDYCGLSLSHLDVSRVCCASEVGVDLFEVALGISASEINQHDSQRMIH